MRLIETCSCGASLEVIFSAPNSEYSYGEKREEKEAIKQVATFQRNHKNCRIMKAASYQERDPATKPEDD